MDRIRETIKALEMVFPGMKDFNFQMSPVESSELPFWLKSAVDLYSVELGSQERLILIQPKTALAFDQIQNVYQQISNAMGTKIMLIADNINPRNRPLLVKFRIPFIFRNETVFAPDMGLVIKNLRPFKNENTLRKIPFKDGLHPFSLKLLAGFLTGKIENEFSLKSLYGKIQGLGGTSSVSKSSNILGELVSFEFIKIEGNGPHKKFIFESRQRVWELLSRVDLGHFVRTMQVYYIPDFDSAFVLAGESALAEYSDLVSPKNITKAISLSIFNLMNKEMKNKYMSDSGEATGYIQLWREDPRLFSFDGKVNPIELYFSMRNEQDERIQIALEQMLNKFGLTPPTGG